MKAWELRRWLRPFMDETEILVQQGDKFIPIQDAKYVHLEEGHLVLVVPTPQHGAEHQK